ncbi:NrfD/PsrC family molybdoenzyme membrane anchor subunit [Thiohalophilus thiocyanatoxydans]|uniref:Molybdopterin-containing oxidoreductase family membrane subunit n=1 Tax=Thiohalophilus thiocyanatoxydans TaxID=381308 RepID=A0A4R8IP86_9GAMM|nr:NrfD/PsrC family molybdoenzyme membrane anchor subunit [Thiohalophilus thiocyanatoxydans]TDY02732.1 molybdopterin-containing oxidoreductase family membrane subunit [Thiohalophilus thiocyanatoxydans]
MKKAQFMEIEGRSFGYLALLGILGAIILVALGAWYVMEHHGHYVTGMNNAIVWGTPHIFAIFLIVAASGALNVASISSVFNKTAYKPLARLSGLLAIALLAGGLMILVLDLGRPDRLIVAMTYYNFKSIFAWNIILYNGFFVIVAVYLWMMMQQSMNKYSKPVGIAAFLWRLILTTGTGSIFGFLVARDAFDAAIMAPMFIIMSFSFGLAIFLLVLMASYRWTGRPLGDALFQRLKNLLGVFVAAVLYFVLAYHLTNLYATEHHGIEAFILRDGGIYTQLFWIGQIVLGSLLPLLLFYHPSWGKKRSLVGLGAVLVIIGGLIQLYVLIIGGQAYPLEIFPGKEVIESSFFDGQVAQYTPSMWEVLLGLGGMAVALIMVALAVKILRFLPTSLADEDVDPHHSA